MPQTSLVNVFSAKQEHIKGKDAWRSNLRLTALAAAQISTSFGPNGAYKMVTYNRGPEKIVKVTKDAVAILEELAIQYPTLVILSEAAKIQRQELGDGVKSFAIFAAALLKKADELIEKGIHPIVILRGYQEATKKALEIIRANSERIDPEKLETLLDAVDCGRGCMTSELRGMLIEAATLASKNGTMDKEKIRIVRKPGGNQTETKLFKGLVVKKNKLHPNMPDLVANARIVLTSGRIGINRLEIKMPGQGPFHMKFNITTPENLKGFLDAEKQQKTEALRKIEESGVNVFFSQQPIDTFSKGKLLEMGILAFETVDRADLALVSKATGARIIADLSELQENDVGQAEKLENDKIGLEKIVTLSGCGFVTFLIRGSNLQTLDELDRLIENSLILLRTANSSSSIVPGGGAIEMQVTEVLKNYALQFSGKEQLAVDSFAEALAELPRCLATNNGLNSDDAIIELKKLHAEGFSDFGLGADGCYGKICVEASETKASAVRRAFEVVSLMLRIDEQISAKEIPKFHK
jgi:chaperonin GroEL (HSP60 family)